MFLKEAILNLQQWVLYYSYVLFHLINIQSLPLTLI